MKKKSKHDPAGAAPSLLQIDGEMTVYRAAELKERMLGILEHPTDLEIGLSGVTEIDSAGIQLLLLAKRSAAHRQRSLRLTGHSPAVIDAFELLNLVGHFGDPIVVLPGH
ncbi:MAG: STAS domain-containing protein [Pseudomonadota bacterium]